MASKTNELHRLQRLNQLLAHDRLIPFLTQINSRYEANWHHHVIAKTIEDFMADPEKRRLAIFVPPQHGKSEISSRALPAWALGRNPDLKIAIASYSGSIANSFNREVQQYMSTRAYRDVFPRTRLNNHRTTDDDQAMKTSSQFEVVGHRGVLISTGIKGGLTGKPVDLLIIDDPVKDELEASSMVARENVWNWYVGVSQTRLHNDSKTILIMTRWHEDDLGGRLLEKQPDKWEVLHLRAIKTKLCNHPKDKRKVGEPLWPERHSLQRLMDIQHLSPTIFDSLYQGDPGDPSGNKVKKDWFRYIHKLPDERISWYVYIDGAYTKKTTNDPTGIMVVGKCKAGAVVRHAESQYMELPELIKYIPSMLTRLGVRPDMVKIEPKASGKSLVQMLRAEHSLPVAEIKGALVNEGKEARADVAGKWMEGGQVMWLVAPWNEEVEHQLTKFPKATHDEYVDLTGYFCHDFFGLASRKARVRRRN